MFRRTIIITSLIAALAGSSLLAQGLRQRKVGPDGVPDQLIQRLQQNLNLTDSQVNGIKALAENRRKEMESLQQEMQQKRQAMRALMQQANPNANEVGNAMLALKETRQRAKAVQERFQSGVQALLTPEQKNQLSTMKKGAQLGALGRGLRKPPKRR